MDEEKSDLLDCGICNVGYNLTDKRPLSLSCGHTICKECVSQIYIKEQQ